MAGLKQERVGDLNKVVACWLFDFNYGV